MANDIAEFFFQQPPFTRTLLLCMLLVIAAEKLRLISLLDLAFFYEFNLEIWRPFTTFIALSGSTMNRLADLYMIYTYSKGAETEKFAGRPARYATYLLFVASIVLFLNYFLGGFLLASALVVALQYTWAQDHLNTPVSFLFGIKFKAAYLPLVSLAMKLLVEGQEPAEWAATGLIAAHLYLFLDEIYPKAIGSSSFVVTPKWLESLLPPTGAVGRSTSGYVYSRPDRNPPAPPKRGFTGRGHRLGD
ncbi:hypothetical protein CANCADRAFT_106334 [Tortispora caseinolytica NRRL Y-17796]|uniref:Derlin n=1 Tax=Tortispora caseinolytica NRRL Y-17796 TaxID=767744 RepID=A0A1E4TFE4_9ASCO|nr:hypothetical protein CANCADRAFT_106334 [Tortispora caseinolytica NRRL Y-17796]